MKPLLSKVCLVTAVAYAAFVASINAEVRKVVVRGDASYQPRSTRIFDQTSTEYLHGVVLQSHAVFLDEYNHVIPPEDVQIDHYASVSQNLYLVHGGHTNSFSIRSDELGSIASWIDNGGTSLFTMYEKMTPELAKEMGMSRYSEDCWVATEFAGTPYAELCHYFDFPSGHLVDANCLQKRHNYMNPTNAIIGMRLGLLDLGDYIVSDLDSRFKVTLGGGDATPFGTLYLYNRALDPKTKKAFVWLTLAFKTSHLDATLATAEEKNRHKKALAFAGATALLRALHDGNPATWKAFEDKFFDQ